MVFAGIKKKGERAGKNLRSIIIYWKYFRSFDWLRAKGEIIISAW